MRSTSTQKVRSQSDAYQARKLHMYKSHRKLRKVRYSPGLTGRHICVTNRMVVGGCVRTATGFIDWTPRSLRPYIRANGLKDRPGFSVGLGFGSCCGLSSSFDIILSSGYTKLLRQIKLENSV